MLLPVDPAAGVSVRVESLNERRQRMAMIDPAWKSWYRAQHNDRCGVSGQAFEKYVEQVLKRLHRDYMNPDPMGSFGDGGSDGIAEAGTVLYACYGSNARTHLEDTVTAKLESDFIKGINSWPSFTIWRFVTNAPFGPKAVAKLNELQQQYGSGSAHPLTLEVWKAPDDLWFNAVNRLTLEQLDEIMPGVPHAQNVELADLVELITALETVQGKQGESLSAIRPVPATKMDYNQLPETTRAEFNEGRQLSVRIDKWFAEQADPGLRDAKAQTFRMIYEKARQVSTDAREIVRAVYGALGGQDFDLSTTRANAVYAVTVYFFDSCDIFDEPPPDYQGGDESHAVTNERD